jgi:hypothetical protein
MNNSALIKRPPLSVALRSPEPLIVVEPIHVRINEHHRKALMCETMALKHAILAGQLLAQVQADLEYGLWGKWVETNCDFKRRTAQNYVKLGQHVAQLRDCRSIREAYVRLGILKVSKEKPPELPGSVSGKSLPKEPIEKVQDHLRAIDQIFRDGDCKTQIIALFEATLAQYENGGAIADDAIPFNWRQDCC